MEGGEARERNTAVSRVGNRLLMSHGEMGTCSRCKEVERYHALTVSYATRPCVRAIHYTCTEHTRTPAFITDARLSTIAISLRHVW